MNQFDDSFSESHELEAPLRSLRPCAPELDIDRILEEPRGASGPPVNVEAFNRQRAWRTVAGAWACGAIVGGLAVFLLMQNRTATLQPVGKTSSQEAAVISHRLQKNETHANSTERSTPRQAFAAAASATIWDGPRGHRQFLSDVRNTSALTAGSHLRPFVNRSSPINGDVMPVSSNRARNTAFEMNTGTIKPPVTRAWLLEELLST